MGLRGFLIRYSGHVICVIGGGIIGLSIAWRLSQHGAQVVIFDAGRRGGEASPAGAGMLAPGGEFGGRSVWSDLGIESHALYPAFVEDLAAESGIPIDYGICGAIEYDVSPERRAAQAAAGIVSERSAEGLFYPNDGYVDPLNVLAALRAACSRRAVRIQEGTVVTAVESEQYEALVVAAGAWSGDLAISVSGERIPLRRTSPIKGHLAGYSMPPGSLGPIRRRAHTYLLQRATGFTIAGSTEERAGFDTHLDEGTCRDIHARAVALWPELAARAPSRCWIGFRPATEDLLPQIGRFEGTNVWCAYGHYRNGILLAPVTARRIADGIMSSLGKG